MCVCVCVCEYLGINRLWAQAVWSKNAAATSVNKRKRLAVIALFKSCILSVVECVAISPSLSLL